MMIYMILYAVLSHNTIQASPILTSGPTSTGSTQTSLLPSALAVSQVCTCPNLRSTWDILWSCLATIFACTWVSIHPNSPGRDDGQRRIMLRRLELMIWSVLIPELIIFWALRQWLGARHLERYYKSFGWTTTHGHFLQMGGFMLVDGERVLEVLTHDRFRTLLKEGTIEFPRISKEEIEALGKMDGLSKVIVFGQTLWFVAQCISRSAQRLVITEIELVTLAFAFLNGLMYFLWWHKPLDASSIVRVPICAIRKPVRLPLTSSTASFFFPFLSISVEEMSKSMGPREASFNHYPSPNQDIGDVGLDRITSNNGQKNDGKVEELPSARSLNERENEMDLRGDVAELTEAHNSRESMKSLNLLCGCCGRGPQLVVETEDNMTHQLPKTNAAEAEPQVPMKIYAADTTRLSRTASAHTAAESLHPPATPSQHTESVKSSHPLHSLGWINNALIFIWRRMAEMRGVDTMEQGAKRVPTFFATIKINTLRGLFHTLIISCIGVGFGAIHCAGWNFVFRSEREKIIWRVNSTLITAFPCVVILYVLLVYRFVKKISWGLTSDGGLTYRAVKGGIFVWYVFVRCLPVYLVARVILLLEALIALGNLPEGAFAQVEWSKFVPHI